MDSRVTIELSDILAQLPTRNHMQVATFDRIASDLSRVRVLNCWLAQLRCSAAAGLELTMCDIQLGALAGLRRFAGLRTLRLVKCYHLKVSCAVVERTVGRNRTSRLRALTQNLYQRPKLGPRFGPTLCGSRPVGGRRRRARCPGGLRRAPAGRAPAGRGSGEHNGGGSGGARCCGRGISGPDRAGGGRRGRRRDWLADGAHAHGAGYAVPARRYNG